MKMGEFGVFVIFTALYAASTLGLPEITVFQYQIKPAEIPSPFVVKFGLPAIFGLVLGHFIASLGARTGPVNVLFPAIALIGLFLLFRIGRRSVFAGSLVYVFITGAWISYSVSASSVTSQSTAVLSPFSGQLIAVLIGYAVYRVTERKFRATQQHP